MKSYGLDLQHTDVNSRTDRLMTGTEFPANPALGHIFLLTQQVGAYEPGSYVFNGVEWATGDVSGVVAGEGLLGGGVSGTVTLSLDTEVVRQISQTTVQTAMQEAPDPVAMALIFGS